MDILNFNSNDFISSIPPELIFEITSYLSYQDILHFCQSSAYLNHLLCRSDYIWRILFRRDISSFITSEDYYKLYLSIMKDFNAKICPKERLNYTVKYGYDILVQEILTLNKNINNNLVLVDAAEYGHEKIVNQMLELGANNYDMSMANAAYAGHENIVNKMLKLGANDYDAAMVYAAEGGQETIVNQMLELGANDYNSAMAYAAMKGHDIIVKEMLKLGANNYNWAMVLAAYGGHESIVKEMLKYGANNYNQAKENAASGGHNNIINLIQEWMKTHQ